MEEGGGGNDALPRRYSAGRYIIIAASHLHNGIRTITSRISCTKRYRFSAAIIVQNYRTPFIRKELQDKKKKRKEDAARDRNIQIVQSIG